MATARSPAFIPTHLTAESCQGESCPTWDMDPIPRRNKTLHHIKSASNYLGVNSKGVFLSQWQLLKMTAKEILHSGWCFIHQDHDHYTFSVARGMDKVTFLRTTVAPQRRKNIPMVFRAVPYLYHWASVTQTTCCTNRQWLPKNNLGKQHVKPHWYTAVEPQYIQMFSDAKLIKFPFFGSP